MTRAEVLARAWGSLRRRAAIFEYPIREMQAREWIETTDDTDKLESELCRFFLVSRLEDISVAPLVRQ